MTNILTNAHVSRIDDPNGIPAVVIHNPHGQAKISLLGANLISWIPTNEKPVIWLSEQARFEVGKSIRGGIPICWPWFGAHTSESSYPAHGFARTELWEISNMQTLENNSTRVSFILPASHGSKAHWPHNSKLEYHITVGETLQLELVTHHLDSQTINLTQALHTYFQVSDVRAVTLHGLENKTYLDKLHNFEAFKQKTNISFDAEIDRIYLDTSDECIIEDPGFQRRIHIRKQGSHSTVVWNPWENTAAKMGDLGENGYLNMLCVESSNAANDIIVLKEGDEHRLWVEYKVETSR